MSFWTLPFVPTSLRSLLQLSQTYRQRTYAVTGAGEPLRNDNNAHRGVVGLDE